MLANHTGIIDSGYRGNLIAAFRCLSNNYTLEKNTRIVQICHPSLCPIKVTLLDDETQLSSTSRGAGGFGSTGLKN
jgi:dUTP pyrophosphatase